MEKYLIKIDKNGSKYYEGYCPCDRCGGAGGADVWKFTGYTCYKCGGEGKIWTKWIERTPEYEAVLAERRAKRQAKKQAEINAEIEAEQAEIEAKRLEQERIMKQLEEEEKARKAVSQYVGDVGEKVAFNGIYDHCAWFDIHPYGCSWMTQTMWVHTFADESGNKFVWKTSSNALTEINEGDPVEVKGTVKDHSEYKNEKQTTLTRCKVKKGVNK